MPRTAKIKTVPAYCFKCGRELKADGLNDVFSNAIGVVYGATFWRSCGNYGSDLYDPMTGTEYLEIVICDKCLKVCAKKDYVKRIEKKTVTKIVSYEDFHVESTKQDKALETIRKSGVWSTTYPGDQESNKRGYRTFSSKTVSKPTASKAKKNIRRSTK